MSEYAVTTIKATPTGPSLLAGCAIIGQSVFVPIWMVMTAFKEMTEEGVRILENSRAECMARNAAGRGKERSVCDRLSRKSLR